MSKRDDGGAAYPRIGHNYDGPIGEESHPPEAGMSLRDYFAGQALAGQTASDELAQYIGNVAGDDFGAAAQMLAETAYEMADAMIAERNKGDDG